ncbi:hypothetical protein ACFE04_027169 [Oxalis oulophora]
MPFHCFQGEGGAIDFTGFAQDNNNSNNNLFKKQQEEQHLSSFLVEPTSVLHMRSQSPPTSVSTLSSFNGGGGGGGNNSTDNTNASAPAAAAPSRANTSPYPLSNDSRKEDWATELQPIPSGLDAGATSGAGGERYDWESVLSETAASPGNEHSLLRWISSDVDDSPFGIKQLLQTGNHPLEFDGNAELGIVDQGPGFEPICGASGNNLIGGIGPSLGGFHGSGFVANNNNGNGKPSSSSELVNYKVGSNPNMQNPVFPMPVSLPMVYNHQQQQQNFLEAPEEKPQVMLNPQQHHSQIPQDANFFMPLSFDQQDPNHLLQNQAKRHNPGNLDPIAQFAKHPYPDPGHEFLLKKQHMGFHQGANFLHQQKPMMMAKHEISEAQMQQNALLDQLYKAAELIGTGNISLAQGILARLNHHLSPVGKPFIRAAYYFKEALQLLLLMNNPVNPPPLRSPTPFDVIFKMGAYKVFSEVSPLIQFVNFTCTQALLEALENSSRIHIVDFDIGFGAQWASFMQELPMRSRESPSLKITAFASPSTHHPVELGLMRDNLTQFANEIGISFELDIVNFDLLEQSNYSVPIFRSTEDEAVAVNFPVWTSSNQPSALPALLRFVKQLSPKVVVSLNRGCDRSDLPFSQHIRHALQSYINLLESLDAVNATTDAVNKIERFLLQPRIETTVLGRLRGPEKMPLWKTLFDSAGFTPVTFSNFSETQAECVIKRTPVRGFHVEKHQATLVLCWQCRELISASAWRC